MIAKVMALECFGALLGSFVPGHFWGGTIGGAFVGLAVAWIATRQRP